MLTELLVQMMKTLYWSWQREAGLVWAEQHLVKSRLSIRYMYINCAVRHSPQAL